VISVIIIVTKLLILLQNTKYVDWINDFREMLNIYVFSEYLIMLFGRTYPQNMDYCIKSLYLPEYEFNYIKL